MGAASILVTIATVIVAIYLFIRKKYSYWAERNVAYIEPSIWKMGNLNPTRTKKHPSLLLADYYHQQKGNGLLCGIYFILNPVALITDIDLVRNILIKDFQYFQGRGAYYNEKDDPLSAHLFNLEPIKWKVLRSKLTPTFTSGKIKFMFPTIVDVADQFQLCLDKLLNGREETLELRELLGRFTTDVIGTCAFGIDCNSLKDPNAKFRQMGRKAFSTPKSNPLARTLMQMFPGVARFFKIRAHHKDVTEFFMNVVKETISYREQNNVQRNDFMNLLMQLKNEGHLSGEGAKENVGRITINEIAAQAYVFFLAGFETSSTTLTYCLHELAINQDIQQKGRENIENILRKHDGKLTYEAVAEMTYIDHIINEALRKYPPAANLVRTVTKEYQVPDTKITLAKDVLTIIPVYGIHHDPKYYPNPEKFLPERFEPHEISQRPSCTFIPFGDGPRNCIGLRFGMLQARIGLITLLRNFKFSTSPKTAIPLVISPKHLVLTPIDGLWLNVSSLKKNQN